MAALTSKQGLGGSVNPDLLKERSTATFNVKELTHLLDGGVEKTLRRKELEKFVFSDPLFQNKDRDFLSKSEFYEQSLQKSVKINLWRMKYNWSEDDYNVVVKKINSFDDTLSLHHTMFIPALERLGTEEQKAQWLPLALSYRIIGTYAQTEIAHGTNLLKLETTATFDPSTDEFVMNTPRISSMKWWPGALGKSSTHAIVLAQLIVGGKNCGLQPFLVQLRSLEDHMPLPGRKLGDIGPKLTLPNIDNGFLIMNNVRIPRMNMLMRNAVVTKEGKFFAVKGNKSNYSTMMLVRAEITGWAAHNISHAAITAVRYSAVRRQSSLKPGGEEVQILDYQAQQYKVLPGLAAAYALIFLSTEMKRVYMEAYPELMKGNKQLLAELHSQTSVMKALSSEVAAWHVEIMRRSLGGHGFLMLSGIATVMAGGLTLLTVEGENTVLYQQTARYIVKQLAAALSGENLAPTSAYLGERTGEETTINSLSDCLNLKLMLQVYRKMARRHVTRAAEKLQADMVSGMEQHEAWNKNMVSLVKAAQAHGWQYYVQINVEGVQNLEGKASAELVAVLQRLCSLNILYGIDTNAGNFLEVDALTGPQLEMVREAELQLLTQIRPDAVALVDAFDIHDYSLNSVLGSYDGNVYERMYEHAQKEPMNKTEVHPSYYKSLRGLIKGTSKL